MMCGDGLVELGQRPAYRRPLRPGSMTSRSPGRRFLQLLSVGEPLALASAEAVAARDVLIELERRGLIAVEGEAAPSIRFSHPLFGEVLRAEMPTLLRRQINQELAQLLRRETARTPADLLKLVVLWQGSGERVDPTILAEAAQVANRLSDHPLAERLAVDSLSQQSTFLAQLELGWSLLRQSRFDEAANSLPPLSGGSPTTMLENVWPTACRTRWALVWGKSTTP